MDMYKKRELRAKKKQENTLDKLPTEEDINLHIDIEESEGN